MTAGDGKGRKIREPGCSEKPYQVVGLVLVEIMVVAVSYTHLDVYKRQI